MLYGMSDSYGDGLFIFFFFKQKTAYEMRISDWSSDVCSSDLAPVVGDYSPVETRHDQARAQLRYDRGAFHAEALVAYWWNREKTLHPQSYLRDTDGNPFYGDAARAVSKIGRAHV